MARAGLWLLLGMVLSAGTALPQNVTTTIGVGNSPAAIAVNPVTSTIYVVNSASNSVSVIDGATNAITTTVNVGTTPVALAVNPLTNMVYVANNGSNDVTVINGATNVPSTITNPNGIAPVAVALNPLSNLIYVANSGSNNLTVINGANNTVVATVGAGSNPNAVVVNPATNLVYVANRSSDNVTVVNGANNRVVATVGSGTNPVSLAVDTATDMVYAANNGSNNLTVINGASNTVAATVGVGTNPAAVTVNAATNFIYVANNGSSSVSVVNGATNVVSNTVTVGNGPAAVAADPTTDQIYVVNTASNNVTVIDGVSNATTTVADPNAIAPVALAVDPVTNTVYTANNGSGNVSVIDADSNGVAATLTTTTNPVAIALDAVTNKMYVVNSGTNTVSVIDGGTNTVVATINTGTNPDAITVNSFTNKVYVANRDANTLTVIDGSNNSVVTTVNTGTSPAAVAVNPVLNTIYVANNGSGTVTVIDGASNTVTTTISAGTAPVALAADTTTGRVYVANSGSDNVTVFDSVASYSITVTDFAASHPAALAVDSLTQKIYVANSFSDNVTVIDGVTDLVVATVNVGNNPTALDLNPASNRIYVTGAGNGTVAVIDGNAEAVIALVAAGTIPSAVSVNPTLNRIYVANHGNGSTDLGSVTVIDGASNTPVTVTDANADQPYALAANPVTNELYVANNLSSNTSVITPEQVHPNTIATTISPFTGNQTSDETPSFNFTASNGLSTAPVDELLFQMDTWQGAWTQASPGTQGNFTGNSARLLPGLHTLYAYATEGEEATSTVAGPESSPLIGSVAAYEFLVATQLADLVPPSLNFGNQQLGTQSPPQTVTLANPGSLPLTFNYSLGGDYSEGSGDTCSSLGGRLAANSSCTIFVVFKPSSTGTDNATLTVVDDANNISESTQTVSLTGTGTTTSNTLNVAEEGSGSGSVTSNPAGISCPTTCAANYSSGTSVVLTATPSAGSTFVGWSGACSGRGTCTVSMNSNQAVTATFTLTASTSCSGTTDNWIGGASGNWSNPNNWSNGVPNSSSVNVCINDGNQIPSQVTLDISVSVGALYIDSGSSLTISNSEELTAFGNISNAGQIFVSAAGNNTFLTLGAGVSLTGGGSVTLSKGGNGTAAVATSGGAQTLTNVDNILQGTGVIGWNGLIAVNQAGGIINANTPSTGTLLVNTSSMTNQGLLEATAGGTLGLQNSFNNLGGRILATGSNSTVQFISGTVQGGILATASNGILTNPPGNSFTLDGSSQGTLTIAGTFVVGNSSTTSLTGTINNTGAIQVNAGGNNTFLTMSGGVSLTGGGTVTLTKGGNGTAAIATSGGAQTLTNVNNTLQGFGVIGWNGLLLTNQAGGTINANTNNNGMLLLNPSSMTNQGLLEATAGGTLQLETTTNNTGGTFLATGSNSSVQFISGSVQGGTLSSASNGILTTPPGNAFTLDGSSQGTLTMAGIFVVGNSSTTYLTGTINNTGAIQVNAAGNNTSLTMAAAVSLTGVGTVTLTKGGNGTAAIASSGGAQTLTNVNNTLQGAGVIGDGLNVINQGTINANLPAQGILELNPDALTNEGLLEATAAATLQLNGSIFNNTGGNILASGTGSNVQFANGAVIQSGTITTSGGGVLGVASSNNLTLDGNAHGSLTIVGTYTGNNSSTTFLIGTINNTGVIQVAAQGNDTFLTMTGGVSLIGNGAVMLSTGGNGTAALSTAGGDQLLTNVNNTLEGFGVIGYNGLEVVNQGTINANVSASTLTVNPSGFTNQGLLEATSGGILALNGSTINNRAGTIQVNGATSSVQFVNSVTIQGGTLAGVNGGVLTVPNGNSITLDGSSLGALTIAGTYAVGNSSNTNLLGMINNTGAIQVNAAGNNTFLTMVGPVSLTGAGTVTLSKGGNGTAAMETAGGDQTLTNVSNTLQGTGVIGWNGLNLVNQAGGIINANTPSTGTLLVNTPLTTNQGLLEATAGGTLGLQNSFNNAGGNILATGSGSTVQFISGTVQGGTLATTSSGTLTNPPGNAFTLDGTSQGSLTIAGNYVVGNSSNTSLIGTINNTGAIQVNAAGNNTFLTMSGAVSLTGNGVVSLSTGGNGTAALETSGGNQLLTNVNNTLQGFGVIGWNGLQVTNQGTINADVSATTLTLNPSAFTNQGLLQATTGGILSLSASTISNRTGTIQVNGASSSVQFVNNVTIQGGTVAGVNGGVLTVPNGNAITLDGNTLGALTIAGTYAVGNSSTTNLLGTINNTGAIQVNAGGNNTFLTMVGAVSLTGSGTVTLTKGGNGTAALATSGGNQTLTNVSNTLQGAGVIGYNGLNVVNQGTINANLPTEGTLVINGGFTNAGLLEATVGGTLVLSNSTLNNRAGTINVNGASSSVQFVNNATIQGGTLATANGGILTIPSGNAITLDGSSQGALNIAGTYVIANSSTTFLLGTINNTGAIQVNAAGNNTFLTMTGAVSLMGAGTVTLSSTGNGTAAVATSGGDQTLTNLGNTLQGTGVIGWNGLNVVNQGMINANVASSLVLNPNSLVNQGLIEATGIGMLQVSTSVSNAGGSVIANGASAAVQFANGITIQGGTLNGVSGGFVGSFNGNVLNVDGTANAVSIAAGATYTIGNNSTTNIFGTIINNGTLLLDSTGSNTTLNAASGGATLTGSGSVMMTSGPNMFLGTSLLNAGNIILDSATFNVGAYMQNAGLFQVAATASASSVTFGLNGGTAQVDGTLAASQGVSVTGAGTLSGNGTIVSNVSMAGVTQAGDIPNPGILTIGVNGFGSYAQSSAGAYDVVIGGLKVGAQYSQLNVPGAVSLSGTLNVSLINSFVPQAGNQFVILTAGSLSNQFVTTNLPALPPNLSWMVNYTATQVVLSVMASNSTFTLTVTTLGTGNGSVTDNFQQINCVDTAGVQSGICSASYESGTTVNLTATPIQPTTFGGWGGACSGTEGCSVLMNSNQSVTAAFVPQPVTMSAPFTCPNNVYPCQNVTAPPAVFNCPSGKDPCPDPNAHSLALTAAQVNTAFTMTVAATEVPMTQADGDCQFGQTPATDFDCRFTSFFPYETLGNGDIIVPACDAYSAGNCVFYSVYFGSRGIEPPTSDYDGPISWSIAWNNTSFLPNPNYPYQINNPRLYDDPDYEVSPITPYGTNCNTPMLINGNPTMPPIYCQFVFDITTYFDPNQPPDAGIGGRTKQFNDVVVAFPLTIAPPSLTVTKVADQNIVNAGSPMGFTVSMSNSAAPGTGTATNTTLNDPLPTGTNISWSINPPYSGPGTCTITEAQPPAQRLFCSFGNISPAISASVHVLSLDSSVGTYVNTATLAASNSAPQMASATIQVVNGSGPIATVKPSKIYFYNVYPGVPNESFVELTNTGSAPMTVGPIQISTPGNDLDDFHLRSFCPMTLEVGKTCKIVIICSPDKDNYSPTATLAINDNAPGSPQTVPLSATVINPQASLSPKFLNFGVQQVGTTSPPKTVTLTNTGTTSLNLRKMTIGGNFAFASGTTCSGGSTLAPNQQCVMNITFTPKGRGKRIGGVELQDNALFKKQQLPLSGMGD